MIMGCFTFNSYSIISMGQRYPSHALLLLYLFVTSCCHTISTQTVVGGTDNLMVQVGLDAAKYPMCRLRPGDQAQKLDTAGT